jgi:hypothetical protein
LRGELHVHGFQILLVESANEARAGAADLATMTELHGALAGVRLVRGSKPASAEIWIAERGTGSTGTRTVLTSAEKDAPLLLATRVVDLLRTDLREAAGHDPATGKATISTCASPGIASKPLYDDCRWKTQNVSVHDNQFHLTPAKIGCNSSLCARQAVISNWGTFPSWSPYMGEVVENAITFNQNNHWSNNQYFGQWRFMAHDTGVEIAFAAWQAAPYSQDVGSTLSP